MNVDSLFKPLWLVGVVFAVLVSVGCSGDSSLGRSKWQDTFLQTSSLSVDILFVVDNSFSMQGPDQEQERLIDAFDQFIANIEESSTRFHIGVTTTDMDREGGGAAGRLIEIIPCSSTPDEDADPGYCFDEDTSFETSLEPYLGTRYISNDMPVALLFDAMIQSLGNGAGWEKGFWAAKTALYPVEDGGLSGAGGFNEGFFREDAKLVLIFVSDEDDCSDEGNPLPGENQEECYTMKAQLRPVFEYVSDFRALKNRDEDVVLSAIVGLGNDDASDECQKSTSTAYRYLEAVDDFGGVAGDICQTEFSEILNELGLNAVLRTRFILARTPELSSLEVMVNDQELGANAGWTYDEESNAIVFDVDSIPPLDATVLVRYYPASG